jgi:uncharacterized protein YqeY|tara:strand:+ start:868 stop:1311 length:444 start_codon:yes stop_codon:yes gene_type:complete
MDYTEKIKQDMYQAMKANDKVKANILRSLLASLKKKQIENKNILSEEIFYSIVKKMAKQLKEAMNLYYEAGRKELAETEKAELEIIQNYLPEQFSQEETSELIKTIITQISAKSISDMGKVMLLVMRQGGGKVDGGIANRIAKQLLQ